MKPLNHSEPDSQQHLLAAYADGELEAYPALKKQVVDWLRRDPEAQAELNRLQQYREWWQTTAPVEPEAETWSALLGRMHQRLAGRVALSNPIPSLRGLVGMAGVTAAAVVFLGVALGWLASLSSRDLPATNGTWPAPPDSIGQLLEVATAGEVEILSVAGTDTPSLVVGELPVRGPLELLAAGEAALAEGSTPEDNRADSEIRMGGTSRPMIWARLASEEDDLDP